MVSRAQPTSTVGSKRGGPLGRDVEVQNFYLPTDGRLILSNAGGGAVCLELPTRGAARLPFGIGGGLFAEPGVGGVLASLSPGGELLFAACRFLLQIRKSTLGALNRILPSGVQRLSFHSRRA